jgi:hypothetical protein
MTFLRNVGECASRCVTADKPDCVKLATLDRRHAR